MNYRNYNNDAKSVFLKYQVITNIESLPMTSNSHTVRKYSLIWIEPTKEQHFCANFLKGQ